MLPKPTDGWKSTVCAAKNNIPTNQGQKLPRHNTFAALLSCADSRVPPEILFDEGIGDLFDIRVAGNIVTPECLAAWNMLWTSSILL